MVDDRAGILIANAPVSYGAFELTVGIDPNVPDAALVLDEVAGAGYTGIDLGPIGYLGDRNSLASALESRGLILSGGFFELPFSDPRAMQGAVPGLAAQDRSLGFNAEEWKRFADGVEIASALCRERGYEPTLHHETGTYLEAEWEIARALELTSIGLCLDTGHLLLGKGDPMRALRDWGDRINHVHLKDARKSVVDDIVREAAPV